MRLALCRYLLCVGMVTCTLRIRVVGIGYIAQRLSPGCAAQAGPVAAVQMIRYSMWCKKKSHNRRLWP